MTDAAGSASRGRREAIAPWMANRIWWVLVEECGCRDDRWDHYSFVEYLDREHWSGHEWRFQGALGFGGKFYNNGGRWWVGFYPEDETPKRKEMAQNANLRLNALRLIYFGARYEQ